MAATLTFRILGCGSSPGVPRIGGDWGQCDPANPRNRRRRASLLVTRRDAVGNVTRVLVDCGPDLREQMLDAHVDWVDGVLVTHAHADHVHGIDDLRAFVLNRRRRVSVHMDAPTAERVHAAFGYIFKTPPGSSYPAIADDHRIEEGVPVTVDGPGGPITALPYRQLHGDITSLGFRFGAVAYSPDVSGIPDQALPALSGLDVLILDALRWHPHPSHFSVEEAIAWAARLKARRTILTHMHIDLDYRILKAQLPDHVEPAFDGMEFTAEV
ncbi:MBL fold metallo-hydrolase [Prosthecomicrobium sp. N25]|uniref:MBL fold metallo-hydrolase n=1 Tax=Prosthecomicrobium sp. N25 TaxID=3129254 RepID=UPI003077C139